MLLYASMTLILLLTSYVIYFTFKRKKRLTCMAGMMISMTNSMMVSISLGAILGTFILSKDLTIPTVVSILIGMVVGYVTGRPISLMAALDGLTAGIMGGMMGSMLGVMLQPASVDLMIFFIDVIFVLVMVLLIRMIEEEAKDETEDKSIFRKPLIANPIFLMVVVILLGALVFGKGSLFPEKIVASGDSEPVKYAPASNSIQEITVTPKGYSPNNIVIEAGKPAVINFKPEKGSACLQYIHSDQLDLKVNLEESKDNFVSLKSLEPGTYEYSCGMNMYKGTITVK